MAILSTYPKITDPFKQGSHIGLNFYYGVGCVRDDNVTTSVDAGIIALTDNTTNYIEITSAGVIGVNVIGFTNGNIPLYTVVTLSGAITNVVDYRCFLSVGGGGGGTALDTTYDNATSGIVSTTVQSAIDEIDAQIDTNKTDILTLGTQINNLATQEAWITPALLNGWVNFFDSFGDGYEVAGYFKDNFGMVHLKGMLKSGAAIITTPIFTLPEGYRPGRNFNKSIASGDSFGYIRFLSNGNVNFMVGTNTWIDLTGISFKAGA